jgi:transposase-like protein
MTENQTIEPSKRRFSIEEKRTYYIAWKNSGLNLTDFCNENGISKSTFYQWSKLFKRKDNKSDFSPLVMLKNPPVTNMTQVTIDFCDNTSPQLKISIPEHRLVSFIKEMCNATSVIR